MNDLEQAIKLIDPKKVIELKLCSYCLQPIADPNLRTWHKDCYPRIAHAKASLALVERVRQTWKRFPNCKICDKPLIGPYNTRRSMHHKCFRLHIENYSDSNKIIVDFDD